MIFTLTRNFVSLGLEGAFCLREQFIKSFHCSSVLLKKLPSNWHHERLTSHRQSVLRKMANIDKSIETILQPLRDSVKQQGLIFSSLFHFHFHFLLNFYLSCLIISFLFPLASAHF